MHDETCYHLCVALLSSVKSLNRSLQAKLSKSIEEASKLDRVRKEFEAMEKEVATMSVARNVSVA